MKAFPVLKGAAATALYGSEGANGAIMITTKSGKAKSKSGKTEVGFSTGYTRSRVIDVSKTSKINLDKAI
ncbi:MAG: hypothetical protein IPO02_01400 [Bacteroidetes bacterium]|nr:hypothetical protein [Bacteroidota bacterium]